MQPLSYSKTLSHVGGEVIQRNGGRVGKVALMVGLMAMALASTFLSPSRSVSVSSSLEKNKVPDELTDVCFPTFDDMPESWRPPENLTFPDSVDPWSEDEQSAADAAVLSGYWEMFIFVSGLTDKGIMGLWYNGVEAFIDGAYAAAGAMPELEYKSLREAARLLGIISRGYAGPEGRPTTCQNARKYIDLLVYAHILSSRLPDDRALKDLEEELVHRTNSVVDDCGTLNAIVGYNAVEEMSKTNQTTKTIWDWVLWSVSFTDGLTIPDLRLPKYTDRYVADTWEYLKTHPFEDGPFSKFSYVVTHAAYISTGYGRHMFKVRDAPWIFKYIREHYYEALLTGDLDLFSEYVDFLRSVGCTEANDAQLRHGARYLLHIYKEHGYQWSDGKAISKYSALHQPWTGMSGLRRRAFEPVVAGTYGAAFREAVNKWSVNEKK